MNGSKTESMLNRVAFRMRIASVFRRTGIAFIGVTAVYAICLLVSRLAGVIPNWFAPQSLWVIPVFSLLLGVLFHHRPTRREAARTVDCHNKTKDLFLTNALLDDAPGEFGPLVARDAENAAEKIRPVEVVPFVFGESLAKGLATLAVLLIAVLYLPTLDPFGVVKAAVEKEEVKKELKQSRKEVEARIAQIKREEKSKSQSDAVDNSIKKLAADFNKMKKSQIKPNYKVLAENQKLMGQWWKKIGANNLQKSLSNKSLDRSFGRQDTEQMSKWSKDMQDGSMDGLNKEIESIKKDLERLMKTADPVEKAQLQEKLRRKMRTMSDFAKEHANTPGVKAALQKAMEQMEMARKEGMSAEALEAVKKSMELAKMELEEVAQSMEDLKKLEESLKTLQMAKKLNAKGELDGKECENCQSMADYEKLFGEMMGNQNEGVNRNREEGGPPVDEAEVEGEKYKTEHSKSSIKAGKVLLTLKTKGVGEKGERKTEYSNAVRTIKQGLSEAIVTEQVPPGYHEGIKKYFDSIEESEPASDAADGEESGTTEAPTATEELSASETTDDKTPAEATPGAEASTETPAETESSDSSAKDE